MPSPTWGVCVVNARKSMEDKDVPVLYSKRKQDLACSKADCVAYARNCKVEKKLAPLPVKFVPV
jgi:hypothetical protein